MVLFAGQFELAAVQMKISFGETWTDPYGDVVGVAVGVGVGDAEGLVVGTAVGDGLGVGVRPGDGDADGIGDEDADGVGDGDAEPDGVGDGEGVTACTVTDKRAVCFLSSLKTIAHVPLARPFTLMLSGSLPRVGDHLAMPLQAFVPELSPLNVPL